MKVRSTIVQYFFAFFTLFVLSKNTSAHNGSIEGYVYDDSTKETLIGATVIIAENNMSTTTNTFGKYFFTDLPGGIYNITVSFLGYWPQTIQVNVNDEMTSKVKTYLLQTAISLQDVTVSPENTNSSGTIKALDMKLRPMETSQDALRLVPGLFIAQHAGGGKAEQIYLRGFDIDHGTDISVNVDGIPVNMVSHAHGQGYADLHFLIPETVSSFDFQKGPYDAHYGDFATAGHVNFNTYDVLDKNTVEVSGGQFNTARALVMLNLLNSTEESKKQSAYVAGEFYITDGPFKASQDLLRSNYFGKYKSMIGSDKIFEFSISNFRSQWNASGQVPERAIEDGSIERFGAIDTTEGGNTGRTNVNLEYTKLLDNNTFIKNQFFYTRYYFELYSNFTFFLNDPVNGDEIKQKEKRNLYGYKGCYVKETFLNRFHITQDYGIGFRYDQTINSELSHVKERNIFINPIALGNIDQMDINAYASEAFHFSDAFKMELAARVDYFSFAYNNLLDTVYNYKRVNAGVPSFKINFDYTVSDQLALYLYSGSGFHSNDTRVVVPQSGVQILPGAYGSDFGIKLKPFSKLILNPAVWVLYLEQEFVYVGDEAVVEPSGKTLRRGVDLTVRWELAKWLFADLDMNYTKAEALDAPEGENYIPLAPDLTSIGGLSVRTKGGFTGSIRYRYMKDRPANEDGSVTALGYFVNDLVLGYAAKKYEAGVQIQNLFNVDWNEAQFDTESQLSGELQPVSELHFTPGVPFYAKMTLSYFF